MTRGGLQVLRAKLKPGGVYRREVLAKWSNNVDRDLATLLELKILKRIRRGLYTCPKHSVFGEVPPDDRELIRAFLKTDNFLIVSPNVYNSMGLGTTQLYNLTLVYNPKRRGKIQLGNRRFEFRRVSYRLPRKLTEDFLLIELMNHPEMLAEEWAIAESKVVAKISSWEPSRLRRAIRAYSLETGRRALRSLLQSRKRIAQL